MLSQNYPQIKIPISLKAEVDLLASNKTKPARATALFRMLMCSMLKEDTIWFESNGTKLYIQYPDLISACLGIKFS
jgi:hypothetical protein